MAIAFAAALAAAVGVAAGVGICFATAKTSEAIARQPEAADKIRGTFILGAALAEATALYGFITALAILILAK